MKNAIIQQTDTYLMNTYGRYQIVLDHGTGAKLYDTAGKKYIDFTSGIGVNCLGYAHPEFIKAVSEQAGKLAHISNLFYTEPGAELAQMICEASDMKKVFLANSGAEANEGAIKLARKYSFDKYGKGRDKIVTLKNSFHGRTISTLAATGQEHFHNYFFPFTEGFDFAPAGDEQALFNMLENGSYCAVMVELIQGEGGVLPLEQDYVKKVYEYCVKNDILFMADEIQTGIGRTGRMFAHEHYGIKPDIMTLAKGLGAGLPIGAIVTGEKCENTLTAGTHGSTFGANPVCCAGAIVAMRTVSDSAFLADVAKKGAYIRDKILGYAFPQIKAVRGMGLMIGVVVSEGAHKDIAKTLCEHGLLSLTAGGDTVRFLPPLNITENEIDEGLAIFEKVFLTLS